MSDLSLWNILGQLKSDKYRWVDLSHEVTPETHRYEGYNSLEMKEVLTYAVHNVCANEYTMVSQYGTHIDPPYHFAKNGRRLHEIGIKEMAYPLCVVDVSEKVKGNDDYALSVADLLEWEKANGRIPAGCFVAKRTDWSKRQTPHFYNKDAAGQCHYPGWSLEALKFLCAERNIAAVGHEPPDTDPACGESTELWAGERYFLEQDRYQVEMLKNLDQLPATGAIIFCTFPNVKDAPGFTARCFAICPAA